MTRADAKRCTLLGVALAVALFSGVPPAAAEERIEPPDVHASVRALQAELELLRARLGRPAETRPELDVRGAVPREVYYQATSLAERSSRLVFEHLRRRRPIPETVAPDEVESAHVFEMVRAARANARALLDALGVDEQVTPPARNPAHRPTDVYRAIVQANRQINLLSDEPFSSSDVWMQVTLAVSYAARLLAAQGERRRVPAAPALEAGRKPHDVYRRLLRCYERVTEVAAAKRVPVLKMRVAEDAIERVVPSDVYDLASLLVSALAYVHSLEPDLPAPVAPYRPKKRVPADVFQRAGILEAQLALLAELVR